MKNVWSDTQYVEMSSWGWRYFRAWKRSLPPTPQNKNVTVMRNMPHSDQHLQGAKKQHDGEQVKREKCTRSKEVKTGSKGDFLRRWLNLSFCCYFILCCSRDCVAALASTLLYIKDAGNKASWYQAKIPRDSRGECFLSQPHLSTVLGWALTPILAPILKEENQLCSLEGSRTGVHSASSSFHSPMPGFPRRRGVTLGSQVGQVSPLRHTNQGGRPLSRKVSWAHPCGALFPSWTCRPGSQNTAHSSPASTSPSLNHHLDLTGRLLTLLRAAGGKQIWGPLGRPIPHRQVPLT